MRTIVMTAATAMLAASASGQIAPTNDTLCHPASNPYDAVTAAPYSHRVLLEDDHVRVLEILLPPSAIEPIHIHALPSVITGDTGGGEGAKFIYTTYKMVNGKFEVVDTSTVTPDPGYRTVYSGPEGPHSIANIGTAAVRYLRMEIKPESCSK
ncbi:MAG TPA: hypothetical protein VG942_16385 [Hyphomonadaceae bacterium]|nr:hypothetical protein [Hyphomonadaceae bacterium]